MDKNNILIVYSSRETGNSKKIASALAEAFGDAAVLTPAGDAPDPNKFAYVIVGFGIYHGWPDGDMRAFMQRCKSLKVGIFLTLGAYPESDHAKICMGRAEGLMQSCSIYGRFVCHGRLDPALVERSKNRVSGPHSWNEERAKRIAEAESHPDVKDLKNAVEIFFQAWEKIISKQLFKRNKEAKKALVLVAFGTSYAKAKQAYDNIERQVAEAEPGVELRWAYTSGMVRAKLKKQGEIHFSVADTLNSLLIEDYTDLEVISTHVVPGAEYHKMVAEVNAFRNGALKFDRLTVSPPLLNNAAKLWTVCKLLVNEIPEKRSAEDAVVLMGHGNHSGRGDMHYLAASAEFQRLDKNIFLATVEGEPGFAGVHRELLKRNIKKAWLMPFMIVAGDHACNDLAGEDADSWKSQLEADNIECNVILKGLGEYNSIAKLFINQ